MKRFLDIDETQPVLERSFKVATKHKRELPIDIEMEDIQLMELSYFAKEIHVKTRVAS